MEAITRLREVLRTLTPSELDGINETKLLFLAQLAGKSVGELELEVYEIEAAALSFGASLTWLQHLPRRMRAPARAARGDR
jgi:hypothetical protein